MIPILYETTENQFQTNGIGRLTDAISCIITQDDEGKYELEMEYPLDGIHANEITNNRFIYAKPERGKGPQPFRIRNIEKKLDGKIKITARHNCYDLSYYACQQIGEVEVTPYQTKPRLYTANDVYIGTLIDSISQAVEVGNNKWNLILIYPASGAHADKLIVGNRILAQPEIERELVKFSITQVIDHPLYVAVSAEATITEPVPYIANMMTVTQAVNFINTGTNAIHTGTGSIQSCPFTISVHPVTAGDTWATTTKEFKSEMPKPLKTLLWGEEGSLKDVFEGEWEFDHYNCIFHEQRGSNNGVQYRYGKNITGITERINIDEIYTHAFSFWKGTASSSTDRKQETSSSGVDEGEYYTKIGSIINILKSGYSAMFPSDRMLIIDASDEFEEEPTLDQLDDYTRKYVKDNSSGEPTVTIEVDIVDLAGTKEYEDIAALEQVNLYDIVTVVFPDFGIYEEAKITEIKYDVLKEKNDKVTIGDVTTSLSNIIARTKKSVTTTKYKLQDWADKAIERATECLAGWKGGNIRKNYNKGDHKQQSMYIMNSDNVNTATKSVKFDEYGMSVSKNGAKGSYTPMVGFAGGGVSFSDEFADSGNTSGSFLKRGTISSGNNKWDLEHDQAWFNLETLTVQGLTDLHGNLTVAEAVTLSKTLSVGGNTTLSGTLEVTGKATLKDQLEVTGNTTLKGTLSVSRDSTLSGTLSVTGNTTLSRTLSVTGNTTLSSDLSVAGNATLSSDLSVAGNTTVTGATTLSTLSAGNTTLTGNLGVTGNTTLAGLSAGNTSITRTLGVTGATTLAGLTAGNTSISGTLGVTGGAVFDSDATVKGTLYLGRNRIDVEAKLATIEQSASGASGLESRVGYLEDTVRSYGSQIDALQNDVDELKRKVNS